MTSIADMNRIREMVEHLSVGQKGDNTVERVHALINEWLACEKEIRECTNALDSYGVGCWGGSSAGGVHELAGRMLRLLWSQQTKTGGAS